MKYASNLVVARRAADQWMNGMVKLQKKGLSSGIHAMLSRLQGRFVRHNLQHAVTESLLRVSGKLISPAYTCPAPAPSS